MKKLRKIINIIDIFLVVWWMLFMIWCAIVLEPFGYFLGLYFVIHNFNSIFRFTDYCWKTDRYNLMMDRLRNKYGLSEKEILEQVRRS